MAEWIYAARGAREKQAHLLGEKQPTRRRNAGRLVAHGRSRYIQRGDTIDYSAEEGDEESVRDHGRRPVWRPGLDRGRNGATADERRGG